MADERNLEVEETEVITLEFDDGVEKIATTEGGILTVGQDKVTLLAGSFKWKDNQ